jgi:signal transduction histidine kinase
MGPDKAKLHFFGKFVQVIIFDKSGQIIESCDSLFPTTGFQASLYDQFPFLKSIQHQIHTLEPDSRELEFPSMDFDFTGTPGIFDFLIALDPEDDDRVVWVIRDYSSRYKRLQEVQFQRNVALMEKERLEARIRKAGISQGGGSAKKFDLFKAKFLSRINHDIRMSMDDIERLLEIMLANCKRDDMKGYIHAISKVASEVIHATDDLLLEFYPEDSRSIRMKTEPFRLRDLLQEREEAVTARAAETSVKLSFSWDSLLPDRVEGDMFNLKKAIHILLSHSISEAAGGTLQFTVKAGEAKEGFQKIDFRITGSKIKASPEPSRLDIAKRLVDIQGGALHSDILPDGSREFSFSLPFRIIS